MMAVTAMKVTRRTARTVLTHYAPFLALAIFCAGKKLPVPLTLSVPAV